MLFRSLVGEAGLAEVYMAVDGSGQEHGSPGVDFGAGSGGGAGVGFHGCDKAAAGVDSHPEAEAGVMAGPPRVAYAECFHFYTVPEAFCGYFLNRLSQRNWSTPNMASPKIPEFIFDVPSTRLVNTMGTSSTRKPPL